jgi:hypothetical protein
MRFVDGVAAFGGKKRVFFKMNGIKTERTRKKGRGRRKTKERKKKA